MSQTILESSGYRTAQNSSIREKFELWRISNLVAELPAQFETINYAGMVCVKGETNGLQTKIGLTEQLVYGGTDVLRETDITIGRETKDPRKIAALKADSYMTDDYSEFHGVPGYNLEHFALDDRTSTMSLSDVKRAVRTASRAVRRAQIAEIAQEIPIIPAMIP
jgi:hypothetical protein